jgi:serine-type D-Ala-D-Ala carboxypeptidase (penicillin-binding protein 5/6)
MARFRRTRGVERLSFGSRRSRHSWGQSERRRHRGRGGLHASRRSRRPTSIALRVGLAVVVLIVLGGVYVGVELSRAVPRPALDAASTLPPTLVVPGTRPRLPWPREGESAVELAGLGLLGSSGPSRPVPIASLAKVMTALVVLHDHPLRPGQPGPTVTITSGEVALYQAESAVNDSVTPVTTGERLTELQLLEALLIPSADNMAPVLARWDTGSDGAFVAKMNSMAARLGMHATHYADENGLSSHTIGTAMDQLQLAQAAAANPVLMSIVGQPALTLPDGTTLRNYDTLLDQHGVIGIKTGSTTAAGGCFMLAARGVVDGRAVEVLGVVLGQHASPLIGSALQASQALISPALASVRSFTAVPAGTTVARVVSPWASPVAVKTTSALSLVGLPGATVRLTVKLTATAPSALSRAGTPVATVTATIGRQAQTAPAVTAGPMPGASLRWRLERL